jgi:hypothetical protein
MSKQIARNLMLAASLLSLFSTAALASSSQSQATASAGTVVSASGPTGTDPEPTEPHAVEIILSILLIA